MDLKRGGGVATTSFRRSNGDNRSSGLSPRHDDDLLLTR
jgi:hypothetical protein